MPLPDVTALLNGLTAANRPLVTDFAIAYQAAVDAALGEARDFAAAAQSAQSALAALQAEYDAHMAEHDTEEPPGPVVTPPTGYKEFYSVDFKGSGLTALPEEWEIRTGRTNNAATFRPQNVAVVPGKGLVHTAERASVGAPVYSGAVNGMIGLPQHHHIRFVVQCTNFKRGLWPSFWARPQGSGQGELDYVEYFGGHLNDAGDPKTQTPRIIGSALIATQSTGSYAMGYARGGDFRVPKEDRSDRFVIECRKTPRAMQTWLDGVDKGIITPDRMTTTAAKAAWDAQFEAPGQRWYLRTDFQISGAGNAGDAEAGPLSDDQVGRFAEWIIERVDVFVPQ